MLLEAYDYIWAPYNIRMEVEDENLGLCLVLQVTWFFGGIIISILELLPLNRFRTEARIERRWTSPTTFRPFWISQILID